VRVEFCLFQPVSLKRRQENARADVKIFCEIDDFCKQFQQWENGKVLPNPDRKRQRECSLVVSKIININIFNYYNTN
jgi:hypothetical protein